MGGSIEDSDTLYYGENVDIVDRGWIDYVQNIDTNTFGDSKVFVVFMGVGIVKLVGKNFEFESDRISNHGNKFEEIEIFSGKLPPETSIQVRAPKNNHKMVINRIRISL